MNGQTSINVSGKLAGLKFGMYSAQLFNEQIERGRKMFIGDSLNELGIVYVLWCGYLNHCEMKQKDPELSFEDFYQYAEEPANLEEIKSALDVWANSRVMKQVVKDMDEPAKKKNSRQTKSGR